MMRTQPNGSDRKRRSGASETIVLLMLAASFPNVLASGVLVKDHVRTLWSLERVPETQMYVMDYYCDYNIEKIRDKGMDPSDIEGSLIRAYLPRLLAPIAMRVYGYLRPSFLYYREQNPAHSCSTATFQTEDGTMYVGRNFDWKHDPCLIVRVHRRGAPVTVSVLDPYYLNFDKQTLENPTLIERLPLLFAPYIVEDGMNEHGVAVSGMMATESVTPFDPAKPSLINSVAKRLILDYATSTGEAVALLKRYNLNTIPQAPTHFMIADSSGRSVVVEFVNGEMKVVPSTRRWQISTNHLLAGRSESENDERCYRYRTGSAKLEALGSEIDMDGMQQVMSSISVENWTMWTSVYNLTDGEFRVAYRRNYKDLYIDKLKLR